MLMVQELHDEQLFQEYVLNNKIIMTEHLTKETFISKVFNYEANKEWKFEGELPCIIDFYADWCGPCKMVAPILEELADEYKDKLNIYKVDTEQETELASVFGIKSIPSLLFVPKNGQPQMAMDALPKDSLVQAFKDVLEIEK
jgi:thioredoxin 1